VYNSESRLLTDDVENWGRKMVWLSITRWEPDLIKVAMRGHWGMITHMCVGKEVSEVTKDKSV